MCHRARSAFNKILYFRRTYSRAGKTAIVYGQNFISNLQTRFGTGATGQYIHNVYSIFENIKLHSNSIKTAFEFFIGYFQFNRWKVNRMRIQVINYILNATCLNGVYIYLINIFCTD